MPFISGFCAPCFRQNSGWYFEGEDRFQFFDASDALTGNFVSRSREEGSSYEIGLNYDRDIGRWSLALIGLVNRNRYENHEVANATDEFDVVQIVTTQDIESEDGETILRGTLAWALTNQHRIELGAEGALNTLESALLLIVEDGGGPDVLSIPNSNVTVEEERADLFGVYTWRPNDQWSVETPLP